ncbi:MAG TPA: hypothetical protein VF192_05360 [Longimicrobiales bacterium]
MRRMHIRTFTLILGGLLAVPAAAAAQACVGSPAASGGTALSGSIGFPEGAKSYGAGLRYNAMGPLSVGAGYTLTSPDAGDVNMHSFAADAAYELPLTGVSVCPVAGAGYSRMSESGTTLSTLTVPVGAGIGYSFQASPTITVIPHAIPQLLWMRMTVDSDLLPDAVSESETEFGALLGVTFQMQRFFLNGGVTKTTVEDSKAVFSLGAGVVF